MADALQIALNDIIKNNIITSTIFESPYDDSKRLNLALRRGLYTGSYQEALDEYNKLCGQISERERIKKVIDFCRHGAFEII